MTDPTPAPALAAEARVLARVLTGSGPSDYVIAQYVRAHQHLPLAPETPFDRTLVAFATGGTWAARAADAYARFTAPGSVLRRKVSVMIAILESTAPSDRAFAPADAPLATALARLVGTGLVFAVFLLAGILLVGPRHALVRLGGRA
jgi:hypothetical protein